MPREIQDLVGKFLEDKGLTLETASVQQLSDAKAYESCYKYYRETLKVLPENADLASKVWIQKYALHDKDGVCLEFTPEHMWDRVATALAKEEILTNPKLSDKDFKKTFTMFRDVLDGFKYTPQGSGLFALGNDFVKSSASNCFVLPSPEDSLDSIFETAKLMAKIYAFRGGIGIDLSNLRPFGASTNNAARTSTGAASFMDFYSYVTGMIGQCIEENQLVLTNRGSIAIKDVVAGDMVWTRVGWVKNLETINNGIKPVYKLTTKRGYEILATDNHVFVGTNGFTTVEKQLGDFKVGDPIVLLPGTPLNDFPYVPLNTSITYDKGHSADNQGNRLNTDITLPEELTEDLAYFVGYSFGDGYVELDKFEEPVRLDLACSHDHPIIEKRLCSIGTKLFKYAPKINKGDGKVNKVTLHSKLLGLYLKQNGLLKQKAGVLELPEAIKQSKTSVQMAFISGYFDADGYASGPKKGYVIASICLPILKAMQQMLMSAGVVSQITTELRNGLEGTENWRDLHSLSVVGASSQKLFVSLLAESVKVSEKAFISKRDAVLTPFNARSYDIRYNNFSYVPDNSQHLSANTFMRLQEAKEITDNIQVLDEVVSIEPVGNATVYDLKLTSEHLFACQGFTVHNSGRRGALMLTMRVDHPDILRFIEMKRDLDKKPFFDELAAAGININDYQWSSIADRLKSTSYANVSVRITDAFMQAVKNDEDFELKFDYNDSSYPNYRETVRARDIWEKLMHSAWESAEPGILNWDHILAESPADQYINLTNIEFTDPKTGEVKNVDYSFRTLSTNPCVTGDNWTLTSEGPRQIKDLIGRAWTAVVDGKPYAATGFWKTATKEVYTVTTKDGRSFKATSDHKMLTTGGWKEVKDLSGESLVLNNSGDISWGASSQQEFDTGWLLGCLVGDGGYNPDKYVGYVRFWGDEADELATKAKSILSLIPLEEGQRASKAVDKPNKKTANRITVKSAKLDRLASKYIDAETKELKSELLTATSSDFQRGFLRGFFDADGSFQGNKTHSYSIRLSQSSERKLETIQQMLQSFGITSVIYRNRRIAQSRLMSDGKGGQKEYSCLAQHELSITRNTPDYARIIGFYSPAKMKKLTDTLMSTSFLPPLTSSKVVGILPEGFEDVYDCSVDDVHRFSLNGVIAHNCGEIPLSGGDSCCLGTFYLPAFVKNAYTPTAFFDWDAFKAAVKIGVRAQDNIKNWDSRILPLEINRISAILGRRISLGTHGLADCLAAMGIKYDSKDAEAAVDNIYSVLKNTAYATSIALGKEKGAFQVWDWEKEKNNPFLQRLDPDVLEEMKQYGRRNIALLTNAPTGSMSVLSRNCSSGIEPIFMKSYSRNVKIPGTNDFEKYPVYQQGVEDCMQAGGDPSVYIEAGDIDPERRVALQAIIQSHIDHAISVTTNLKNETPVETIDFLYREAFEKGCKGFTVYRDGCRTGVLNTIAEKVEKHHKIERPKTTNIDIHKVKYRDKQWAVLVGKLDNGPIEVFAGIEEDTPLPNKYHRAELTKKSRGHYSLTVYLSEDEDDIIKINNIGARFPLPEGMTLTRFISLALRNGVSVADICEQLTKSSSSMFDYPAVLNRVLKSYITEEEYSKKLGDKPCPDCGKSLKIRKQDGCLVEFCECGYHYSKCN